LVFLLLAGAQNSTWGATVTYHILTLPIDPTTRYDYHMKSAVTGHRLEALKVVVNQSTVGLPDHYKSPLATGFTYYKPDDITSGGSAIPLYDDDATAKGILYDVKANPTPVAEGTAITTNTAEYYVVYTYNSSNTLAQLDGSVNYNIGVKGKGFLSLNRGRNNRPAVIPTAKVDPAILSSEDFSYVDSPGNNISPYWNDGNNKNSRDSTESKFFFIFKFEGEDPYHIVLRTSYARDYTYIEKNEEGDKAFVYKWYKEAALMAKTTGNAYLTSDDHIRYKTPYSAGSENPKNPAYDDKTGYFHGNQQTWGTLALLNNTSGDGYVLMGTRTVDVNGVVPGPTNDNKYYYLTFDGYNNLKFGQNTAANATKNHTVDGIYPLKKVTFKIATPFYKVSGSTDDIVSAPTEWVSQYTIVNDPIETKYLPTSLQRKYCTYTKFYKDAACTQEITKFSQANYDNTEGYQVYIGYEVSSDIPFKAITPAATYTDDTWKGATWYELTDEGSTKDDDLKLKYDDTNFKNNGTKGEHVKTSEYAFIGDPYELRVVLRSKTQAEENTTHVPYYVGATGTRPATGTLLTASTSATEGYKWELPKDDIAGSFLLRKYQGTGNWYWDAGHPSPVAVSYATKTHTYNVATANAQTVTFNVSNLGYTEGDYILVTAGGTNADQVTVTSDKIYVQEGGIASFTAAIKGRGDSNKQFTLSIQKYNSSDVAAEDPVAPSVITVNQNNAAVVANTVQYSTSYSTRVKVLTLPEINITYNIVDKSGRIAVKATAKQTVFSPISLETVPSIIVSPLLAGETVTFYSTFDSDLGTGTGTSRKHLSNEVSEVSNADANIYIKYTTSALASKPFKLSEDQEIFVKLNGQYIYYEGGAIKSSATYENTDNYRWKLRNRDPYDMLIDNMAARTALGVANQSEYVTVYDDNGNSSSELRQKGAWVWLNNVALPTTSGGTALAFTANRTQAEHFIAKSSTAMGVYEVMVATGAGVDASTTYYNIGRPAENTVKIYNNTTYAHGNAVLAFRLEQSSEYIYHLIDMAKHELLTVKSKSPELVLPAEYQSPLVGTYNYYATDQMTKDTSKTPNEYTPEDPANKYITDISGLDATWDTSTYPAASNSTDWGNAEETYKKTATDEPDMLAQARLLTTTGMYHFNINNGASYKKINVTRVYQGTDIYVTYVANDVVNFNKGQYMLKFLNPLAEGYYLEDGLDKLTTSKIKAVYPYCNGDGNMNIYGDAMQKEQFNGGANTRPRWVWYFDSTNSDPYHVTIRSRSTIKYNDVSHYTYLTTYVVHYNQDVNANTKHVVTGGTLPTIASIDPTEYMVLGTPKHYRLLTTNTIDDGTTIERRNVTSLEQYWKTYNMIKLDVLGISNTTDAYSDDASTWVVPNTPLETTYDANSLYKKYNDTHDPDLNYRDFLDQQMDWHSYNAYANATRWNGYNDKSDGHEKKVVENLEHWYQTFDMGDGTFDIESADIPPVLVLLDRHGWEIMRRPLPSANTYPEGNVELAGLRVYDSPLVDKYYFYSNATKATGCHKYTLRLDDKGAERDQIKVNGVHYSSKSLGDLPPKTATGVVSDGAIQDFYVTYTVKEEYESKYAYNLDYTETKDGDKVTGYTINSETGTSQPYLVLQNGRFYKAENTLAGNHNPSYISKPISEHTNPEGGNVYDLIVSPKNHGGTNNNIIDGSGNFIGNNFWLVKPNLRIDEEMGIKWGTAISGAEPLSKAATQVTYKNKSGFDPYNIQLQLVKNNSGADDGRYLTTHMTSAHLDDGIMVGDYSGSGGSMKITLEAAFDSYDPSVSKGSDGYDHTNLQISNQTFMAVSDVNGNMQLMPRFDHTQRVNLEGDSPWESKLSDPVVHELANVEDNSSGPQTTFFVSPQRFHYHIIDNNGREALAYKRGADSYPTITSHFKSPVAKDFIYYSGLAESNAPVESSVQEWGPAAAAFKKSLTNASMLADAVKLLPTAGTYYYRLGTRGVFTYKSVVVTKGLSEKEITGSFAAAELSAVDNDVYVRYSYDEDADHDGDHILIGKWFTVDLAEKDLQANGTLIYAAGETQGTGINLYAGAESRSLTATNADDVNTQAKKLGTTGDYYFKQTDADNYWLVNVTTAYDGTTDATYTGPTAGSYATQWANSKPLIVNGDDAARKWQWKFFVAPADPTSDYYVEPDPYAIHLFNRQANYTTNPSLEPSPMNTGIKVPNANDGADRFALLQHPSGGYALVVAKAYGRTYDYLFLNGADMTVPDDGTPQAATTAPEANFNYKTGTLTTGSLVVLNDDVEHNYTYNVITNAGKLAITAGQNNAEAESHNYEPYLPESAQTPLLNMSDYLYYGFASRPNGDYSVIPQTLLYTLYGLYDDVVYVRYNAYDVDKTPFKVPNKRNATDTGQVERNSGSVDASMNISGGLPYNIVWYNDNMMQSTDDAAVSDGGSHALSGNKQHIWYFTNNDPYALKIKHKGGRYLNGTGTMVEEASAPTFMLLRKDGYDYGILQKTNDDDRLSGYGETTTTGDPTKYVIFGLSIHNLIYHLVIAKSCADHENPNTGEYVDIPYSEKNNEGNWVSGYSPSDNKTKRIYGTTQRDLTSGSPAGATYQLGSTITWNSTPHTYSYNAGSVSIGDDLVLPNIFYRPNCKFDFYIEGIYQHYSTANPNEGKPYTDLENKYKGLKLDKLMSDEQLIDQDVVVNVVYSFDTGLETNSGDDFVTKMEQAGSHYLWYTFETTDATPQLAHYTFVRGMRAERGRALHYTNDYLWSPLGDPYGFRMYNRYIYKNKGESTTVMTTDEIEDGQELKMGAIADNGIYELLPSGNIGTGSFRVHPLLDTSNTLFLSIVESGEPGDIGKLILSDDTPVKEWTYGLSVELLNPHYQGAGNVGGLTTTAKPGREKSGEALYEEAQTTYADKPAQLIRALQQICYNKDNIVDYAPGYYRLCNQPGASSLSPQRYASGYLHDIEKTAGTSSTPIPMHFYSKVGVTGTFDGDTNPLKSGYTETDATRGDIPIPATEYDPSTIFYFTGAKDAATMQTQGLYVQGTYTDEHNGFAKMTASAVSATSFHVEDIGGAVVIIYNEVKENEVTKRRYINYGQNASIYDLKYFENVDVDGSKWCMEPANKQGLKIATNQGGDGHYYATFYAPFDVLISDDVAADIEKEITAKNYYAYYCKTWDNAGLHPTAVPATTVNAEDVAEGKFVPAETPVIIRTTDESNVVTLTLPTTSPTASSITTDLMGTYLEKLLPVDASHDVYTLGLPFTSGGISIDRSTGVVTAPLKESATTGVGFYINATPNKEHNALEAMWQRNNRYVLHNKIYYRASSGVGGDARENNMTGIQFVPVIFGDEEEPDPNFMEQTTGRSYPAGVFNLQGQQIATEQEIEDGTWRQRVAPGIYIVNGKKIAIK